jgi:hypothetical protein
MDTFIHERIYIAMRDSWKTHRTKEARSLASYICVGLVGCRVVSRQFCVLCNQSAVYGKSATILALLMALVTSL